MLDSDAAAAPAAAPDLLPPAPATSRVLEIRFTGSGSEYFRIWAVNMLLTLVTVGLYLPFAKARRIRYFYANTLVDGQALGFHGDPWKMFRGFVLLVVLMATYSGAGRFSPTVAVVAFLILCSVWPALWRASLQFRLGNTSWRGLRLRFEGSLKNAYLACAPMYLPMMVFAVLSRLMAPHASGDPAADRAAFEAFGYYSLAATGLMLLMSPWSFALFKRYQHNGYRIAGQHGRLKLSVAKVYLLGLKTIGVSICAGFLALLAAGLLAGLVVLLMGMGNMQMNRASPGATVVFFGFGLLFYLLMFSMVMPFAGARMQNLAWSGTRSEALGFESRLKFRSLFALTLKNWLLTALTLGLYRPFAAVATARLRLEAVSIGCDEDPSDWVSAASSGHADATGDIAGDFFGIDMGL